MRHGSGQGTPVVLLYLEQEERSHYVLITDFNKFMNHRTKNTHRRHVCMKCLYGYPQSLNWQSTLNGINKRFIKSQECQSQESSSTRVTGRRFVKYLSSLQTLKPNLCLLRQLRETPILPRERSTRKAKSSKFPKATLNSSK